MTESTAFKRTTIFLEKGGPAIERDLIQGRWLVLAGKTAIKERGGEKNLRRKQTTNGRKELKLALAFHHKGGPIGNKTTP